MTEPTDIRDVDLSEHILEVRWFLDPDRSVS